MCLFFYRYWLELRGFSPADVIWLNHIGDEIFTKRHKISHLFRCQRLLTIILNCLECIATRARAIPYIGHEILVLGRLVSIFRDQEQLCTLIITIVNDGDILGIPSMSKNISCKRSRQYLITMFSFQSCNFRQRRDFGHGLRRPPNELTLVEILLRLEGFRDSQVDAGKALEMVVIKVAVWCR